MFFSFKIGWKSYFEINYYTVLNRLCFFFSKIYEFVENDFTLLRIFFNIILLFDNEQSKILIAFFWAQMHSYSMIFCNLLGYIFNSDIKTCMCKFMHVYSQYSLLFNIMFFIQFQKEGFIKQLLELRKLIFKAITNIALK